jgi:hypothetical protein
VAIAETESTAKAAKLCLSISALNRYLTKLEGRLGWASRDVPLEVEL